MLIQLCDAPKRLPSWKMKIKHFAMLLTAHTRILDFSVVNISDENTALHLLQLAAARGRVCQKSFKCSIVPSINSHLMNYFSLFQRLTTIQMNGTGACPIEYYCAFLPQFRHLQVLDVSKSESQFNDACLVILGIYCTDLRYGVSKCT